MFLTEIAEEGMQNKDGKGIASMNDLVKQTHGLAPKALREKAKEQKFKDKQVLWDEGASWTVISGGGGGG